MQFAFDSLYANVSLCQKRELGKKILFLSPAGIPHLLTGAFEVTAWSSEVVTFCDLVIATYVQSH